MPDLPVLTLPIHTQRLVLRDFRLDDEAAVHAYGSDPEVVRYTLWGPNTEAETREFLGKSVEGQRAQPREEYGLAICLAQDDRPIGSIGLHPRDLPNLTMEIGYCLHRAFWGQGVVVEAVRAVLDAAFGELGLHRVFATCDVRNVGSWRVMEKLGMRREACLLQDRQVRGEWRDTFLYAILAQEWRLG
jgi:RimJ/RimL family protein N-acetyltransferase